MTFFLMIKVQSRHYLYEDIDRVKQCRAKKTHLLPVA